MIDIPLQSLKPKLKTEVKDGKAYVYDIIRKKLIVLQPEELVRQLVVLHLIDNAGYPISRIQIERGVATADKLGRFDIIIYDKDVEPWMLIECKSHRVNLNQSTVDQLSIYNKKLAAPYYMVSNGINTFCYTANDEERQFQLLESLPTYPH